MQTKINREKLYMLTLEKKRAGHPDFDSDTEFELARQEEDEFEHDQFELHEQSWLDSFGY